MTLKWVRSDKISRFKGEFVLIITLGSLFKPLVNPLIDNSRRMFNKSQTKIMKLFKRPDRSKRSKSGPFRVELDYHHRSHLRLNQFRSKGWSWKTFKVQTPLATDNYSKIIQKDEKSVTDFIHFKIANILFHQHHGAPGASCRWLLAFAHIQFSPTSCINIVTVDILNVPP